MDHDLVTHLESYYHRRLASGSNNAERLGWENPEAQECRFRALAEHFHLSEKHVLDVGSGLGDMYSWLLSMEIPFRYTGTDLLPVMVAQARESHPGADFRCVDVIGCPECLGDPVDIVFCAGVFNLGSCPGMPFLQKAFDSFTSMASEGVVISLLDRASPDAEPDQYCYFDPVTVQEVLSRPGWNLETFRGYLPNDFCLVARRMGA